MAQYQLISRLSRHLGTNEAHAIPFLNRVLDKLADTAGHPRSQDFNEERRQQYIAYLVPIIAGLLKIYNSNPHSQINWLRFFLLSIDNREATKTTEPLSINRLLDDKATLEPDSRVLLNAIVQDFNNYCVSCGDYSSLDCSEQTTTLLEQQLRQYVEIIFHLDEADTNTRNNPFSGISCDDPSV